MAKKKSPSVSIPVEAIKHTDTRKNIPTEELRDFLPDEPPKAKLYPRDMSLDPQLVWKGKDEQDAQSLEVPVVPIYIQEKIHPQAIIEDFKRRASTDFADGADGRNNKNPSAKSASPADQLLLFSDFNGIDTFDKKVDFYHHDQHWSNRMILGDSLAVMTSLAEKEGLKGQVQTIYFDPPYGIKFGSNWQVSTRKRDVKDGKAEDATRQPEQVRAFRDTWELGIHSYLAYLRDRLTSARDLLTETGSVFVQIGDENVHLVRSVMDEVFGSENFCSIITFAKTSGQSDYLLSSVSDYIIWYARNQEHVKYRQLYLEKNLSGAGGSYYTRTLLPDGTSRTLTDEETDAPETLPTGSRIYRLDNLISQRPPQGADLREFVFQGKAFTPGKGTYKSDLKGLQTLANAGRIEARSGSLAYVRYLDDFPVFGINSSWTDTAIAGRPGDKIYVVQTASRVIERCLLMTTDPGDLVLDPTCGSGTTAYVAEQWGRRWITLDTSRVALALARTRLMAARFPFYYLADSYPQISQMDTDENIKTLLRSPVSSATSVDRSADIKKGFVYKRVPHVTLKSIANNPDIKEGMTRAQIDAAIAKHADTELLFDKPYEDSSKVRVTGPFTVESLSPHRRLTVETKKARAAGKDGLSLRTYGPDQFGTMILDNLRKSGIQARDKTERLKFDSLEPFAGEWIHATGEFTDSTGTAKRVAVCIGPEHGTVGPELIKEAAKETVKGRGFDLLYILGFAFDPHVDQEIKNFGKLNVQICRMNPDLSMGDELLKKTGAGNLFMVFGEPDIEIRKVSTDFADDADGKAEGQKNVGGEKGGEKKGKGKSQSLSSSSSPPPSSSSSAASSSLSSSAKSASSADQYLVKINGVDVYDPTTGEIRSRSTDDIACWFIDTNYDGESFFVRHAYFTGAQEPYDKLKRALRADIDEAAWSALYSTISQPFARPETGKIAVKVINHYGDEVLKVYSV